MLLAAAGALALAVFDSSEGFAQEPQHDRAPLTPLETGISAYQEGALEVSVETLSGALEGDLSRQETAKALYFRGLAYRELGKPGQAISDLTTAISLKNGLSKAQLKDAVRNREGAYREAGITTTESVIVEPSGTGGRLPVAVSAHRVPVPVSAAEDQPAQPDPPPTSAMSSDQVPPMVDGGFVAAVEKLIPDWP
jgi:tetratricopeptide (TPR) repeat protein